MARGIGILAAAGLLVAGQIATADAAVGTPAAGARVIVVAPNGSNHAAGTPAHPIRTIQLAVHRLRRSGGTVELKGGTYHQRVRLSGVAHLVIRPYGRAHPVLSGAGLTPPRDLSALVEINAARDVTVRGLELTGYRTSRLDTMPVGIYIRGHDRAIAIVGNHVHDLGNYNRTRGSYDINAHGIAVYGDDPRAPVTGLRIVGNEVDHLHLGASESVVVNGNVSGWRIVGNTVHDNNNIGIDAIGFEPTLTGRFRYTDRNRARHGLIADNTVVRIRSRGNPAYWENGHWCNCADGIYVDGGSRITIRGNHVRSDDIGIEVAAENRHGRADHVLVARNHISRSRLTGIATGGYCDGRPGCGGVRTGSSRYNVFRHNWLRGNNQLDDGSPEVLIQYRTSHDRFVYNTITATDRDHAVYASVPRAGRGVGNISDHNTFVVAGASAADAGFGWDGRSYTGFGTYRRATGQDPHSTCR
jgi:hypothetical protein